jgi:hypothetical protein
VILFGTLLCGCSLFGGLDRDWVDSAWYSGSEEVLWDATLDAVGREYDLDRVSPVDGTFETKWKERFSPFKGEGRRWKVEGKVEKKDSYRRVRIVVLEERNQEIDSPLDPAEAKWRGRREDAGRAGILLRHIHNVLLESGFRVESPGS